ncbi:hypothetical protein TNCV_2926591 [Trichonephila clavipes]|nr:hypothetical protein TNCV_2926591 [Trichonephila clavipes]
MTPVVLQSKSYESCYRIPLTQKLLLVEGLMLLKSTEAQHFPLMRKACFRILSNLILSERNKVLTPPLKFGSSLVLPHPEDYRTRESGPHQTIFFCAKFFPIIPTGHNPNHEQLKGIALSWFTANRIPPKIPLGSKGPSSGGGLRDGSQVVRVRSLSFSGQVG